VGQFQSCRNQSRERSPVRRKCVFPQVGELPPTCQCSEEPTFYRDNHPCKPQSPAHKNLSSLGRLAPCLPTGSCPIQSRALIGLLAFPGTNRVLRLLASCDASLQGCMCHTLSWAGGILFLGGAPGRTRPVCRSPGAGCLAATQVSNRTIIEYLNRDRPIDS
jgi:hypothetical protein